MRSDWISHLTLPVLKRIDLELVCLRLQKLQVAHPSSSRDVDMTADKVGGEMWQKHSARAPPHAVVASWIFKAPPSSQLPISTTKLLTTPARYYIMAAEQRKLLEQLMGASSTSRAAQLSMNDPKVCRSYIAGTCPHDLFTNTKQDIGPCPKVHSEGLKAEYEGLSERERQKYGFEYDYMRDLQKYIDECNRRIDAAQRRLEKTPDEIRQTNVLVRPLYPHVGKTR